MVQTVRREKTALREQRETPVKKAIQDLKDLKVIKAILGRKYHKANRDLKATPEMLVRKGQRETRVLPERLALTVKVLTPLLKLVVTRTHRRIFTQTLPPCRDLRRHLRLYQEVGT